MQTEEGNFGLTIKAKKHLVFFGKKSFQKNLWKENFPHKTFISLHQTHSKTCLEANTGPEKKADAHYSYEKNRALIIKTADCVPLMFYCPVSDTILAIHAGWMGLVNKIIKESIEKAFPYSKRTNIKAYVGPHIAIDNYEFQKEDILLLQKQMDYTFHKKINEKYYFDLKAIYMHQLHDLGLENNNIHLFNTDTYSSEDHYSYRRNKTKERLYHFILRFA